MSSSATFEQLGMVCFLSLGVSDMTLFDQFTDHITQDVPHNQTNALTCEREVSPPFGLSCDQSRSLCPPGLRVRHSDLGIRDVLPNVRLAVPEMAFLCPAIFKQRPRTKALTIDRFSSPFLPRKRTPVLSTSPPNRRCASSVTVLIELPLTTHIHSSSTSLYPDSSILLALPSRCRSPDRSQARIQ